MQRQGNPRRVLGVVLRSQRNTYRAELEPESTDVVCLNVTGADARKERCSPLHDVDSISLMETALLTPAADPVFLDTLRLTAGLFASGSQN